MSEPGGSAPPISLDEFVSECRAFLDGSYEPKVDTGLRWGEGSDRVGVFEEPDPEEEQRRMRAVREWRRRLFDAGLGWITGPIRYGGRDLPLSYQRAFDRLARGYDVPGNGPVTITLGMVAPTILAHGTEAARNRYLAALHRGDLVACQLFSEPGAGSDLASVSTTATRDGDGWRISGQKVWTSGAQHADIGEVLCRTGEAPRHRNLTAFVIDMGAPGVEVRPLRQMTGGAAFNEVFLDSVWVPDEDRLGDIGAGWQVALTTLRNERSSIGSESFGGAGLLDLERFKAMVHHCGRRDDPLIRQHLARLYCGIRAAKYMRQRAEAARRRGLAAGPEGPLGKLALARNMAEITAFVSALLGPSLVADSGRWGTYAWANFVLGAPGYRLGGGTDEVIKNIIAERALGLPREPAAPMAGPGRP
ncbi:MAG: Crotonobetainyl-CoA dehydrogenase [Acidimicrobiales bacterium]|nr:MAG: acyl-CoA dehydrogenase [Actinomycetota bacterium]MBV6508058.1 Crotonobetainyl-CoA dehydrogenase [Acidimicrobiales bacterium]RIK05315.1 MAG: acyl-CoA dehydrogenase [Acidobacteriota bacterium]